MQQQQHHKIILN